MVHASTMEGPDLMKELLSRVPGVNILQAPLWGGRYGKDSVADGEGGTGCHTFLSTLPQ